MQQTHETDLPGEVKTRLIGLGVPQANPTVEQEAWAMRPAELRIVTARLTSSAPSPRQRIIDYFDAIPETIAQFGDLGIDAFGFACTGSSYLLGPQAEAEALDRIGATLECPIVTAARAIRESLALMGLRRPGIVAPYPAWLAEPAGRYFEACGFGIGDMRCVPLGGEDTNAIYSLSAADALREIRQLDLGAIDSILISGTGMASLAAIPIARAESGLPVMSSNTCLMTALCRRLEIGHGDIPT